jgi:hypothetical protein
MLASRLPIDADVLRAMYVDERITIEEIATRLRCGASTIGRRLHEFGLPVRPRGPSGGGHRSLEWASGPRWSAETAWVVGLIATDGNLANTGLGMSIRSKDVQLLETAGRCLGVTNRVARTSGGWGDGGYRLQWRSRDFYRWLVGLGLTPRKSLTLGPLAVPDEYFADFFRGCIDGDGTVLVYTDRYHATKKASYVYRRLYVSLVSASHRFIAWIRETIHRLLGLRGAVHIRHRPERHPVWVVRYSKKASIRLLRWMYHSADVPCLARKLAKAEEFLLRPP